MWQPKHHEKSKMKARGNYRDIGLLGHHPKSTGGSSVDSSTQARDALRVAATVRPEGRQRIGEEWSIERVVVGDGTKRGKVQLVQNKLYASDRKHGGPETFFEIDDGSMQLFDVELPTDYGPLALHARRDADSEANTEITGISTCSSVSFSSTVQQASTENVGAKVQEWLFSHPGVILNLHGPGARAQNPCLQKKYTRKFGKLVMKSNDGLCALSATVNAIAVMIGREVAETIMKEWVRMKPKISCLKDLTHMVQSLGTVMKNNTVPKIQLQRIRKQDMEQFENDRVEWLSKQEGMWLVRLEIDGVADHVVFVDGRNRLIWDSAEEFPLDLTGEVLKACGGGNARKVVVTEVRQLVMQRKKRKLVEVVELE